MQKNIVITGGHVTPAVAVIEEVLKRGQYSIYWYGRKYAFTEAKHVLTFEYETIKSLKIPFCQINAPRFPKTLSVQIVSFMFQFLAALSVSLRLLTNHKPGCVISFGGYVGAPVILAGWMLGIPILIHEQTLSPGRANKVLSFFAKIVCASWEQTRSDFPFNVQNRCVVTGNPMRRKVRDCIENKKYNDRLQTIYITGGSTGAHRINVVIHDILPQLTAHYKVIHQCGDSYYHDFEKLTSRHASLAANNKRNYTLHKYITNEMITEVLTKADILIGRAGANTTVELAVLGIPSVLIPLPESSGNEQQKQAEMIRENGAGIIIAQHDLTGARLLTEVGNLAASFSSYQNHAKKLSQKESISIHKTAHRRIVDCCDVLVALNWRVPVVAAGKSTRTI